jgi:hypothetical protein
MLLSAAPLACRRLARHQAPPQALPDSRLPDPKIKAQVCLAIFDVIPVIRRLVVWRAASASPSGQIVWSNGIPLQFHCSNHDRQGRF